MYIHHLNGSGEQMPGLSLGVGIPSGGSREAARIPWLMTPSSIFRAGSVALSNLAVTLTFLLPSYDTVIL